MLELGEQRDPHLCRGGISPPLQSSSPGRAIEASKPAGVYISGSRIGRREPR
jgi:hypothetical protein